MKYFKQYKGEDKKEEASYGDALHTLLGSYQDNEITRKTLLEPGIIPCVYSTIYVEEEE